MQHLDTSDFGAVQKSVDLVDLDNFLVCTLKQFCKTIIYLQTLASIQLGSRLRKFFEMGHAPAPAPSRGSPGRVSTAQV